MSGLFLLGAARLALAVILLGFGAAIMRSCTDTFTALVHGGTTAYQSPTPAR